MSNNSPSSNGSNASSSNASGASTGTADPNAPTSPGRAETADEALYRGMQRARSYEWGGAVEAFRKAVVIDPENVEARFRLGWSLWNQASTLR